MIVEDILQNPLYQATEFVEAPLLTCPDALTNVTQVRPLLEHSCYPFYVLEHKKPGEKGGFILHDISSTPKRHEVPKTKRQRAENETSSSCAARKKRAIVRKFQ